MTNSILDSYSSRRKPRRIGILTSGGDAPGMNGAIRAVVRTAIQNGCEAWAIHEGYEGLIQGGAMMHPLYWEDVRGFLSRGGTLIGSVRCDRFREREGRLQAARNMVLFGIDALVVCGGDGSLTGADLFRSEWPELLNELVSTGVLTVAQVAPHQNLNIVGLLGSIDNDFSGTDATIGCYSALTRICEAVDAVFDTASSHRRGFVVEVMGRHCGWLALMAAIATGADWLFIPERPPRDGWEDDMCSIITKNRNRGKRRTIVILAEGAQDSNLDRITSSAVKNVLSKRLGLDTRVTVLGHIQRGGSPCAYDRWLSTLQGIHAVKAVLSMTPDSPSPVVIIQENRIKSSSLAETVALTKEANASMHAKEFEKATTLRDPEFMEYHSAYRRLNTSAHPKMVLPENKRMRVAIIHVGAPAAGMNPATRAAVAYCLTRGHTPIAIHNGFPGLCRHHDDTPGSVREMHWLESGDWINDGGSDLGTNAGLPLDDIETTAQCFERYKFDALFVIGGFEAFTAVSQLRKAREQYPAFRIPLVLLPASMSNNVPGTEYSLGSDTSLNTLVYFCDVVRQSASSSGHSVFVVEAQGAEYQATAAALAAGAMTVYTPDRGITLQSLSSDIEYLRQQFSKDHGANRSGKLIIRNDQTSTIYSTAEIANIIKHEAKNRFDAQGVVPGHFQQGGKVSPIDRIRAFRLAVKCMEHLETFTDQSPDEIMNDENSATVISIKQSRILLLPMGGPTGVEATDTDWKRQRPKTQSWLEIQEAVDSLSGRSSVCAIPN
ncbi:6-phosphofructokinase [Aspergillus nomiae NRRL 13137]|uniref:ATP-dependent 6-phosphofructokinase n=1 Tax=Aspergillus nomiae NRRL (strain ATCC 15546 / NRRL 13137 / CBS 260.88 / M93) TaxID=1509407 RepID=A0A0L1J4N9_ASPN3|nr:6-phosphofructokinase [Aspergillus nomiae NRRL 13137]KNG86702.1 6-phosphofructokinase [Aspergillus nomiae NRRL 13137]